jgi:DNA-directed RNA polymerase subunit RPC12/RpoP
MSKSAHAQSIYQLRKLPTCSRCNSEFALVCSQYGESRQATVEWECPKCHKVVARGLLREEPPSSEDAKLTEFCKQEDKDRERRVNRLPKQVTRGDNV